MSTECLLKKDKKNLKVLLSLLHEANKSWKKKGVALNVAFQSPPSIIAKVQEEFEEIGFTLPMMHAL